MTRKPVEMSLVSGGLSAEEMNEILGARCVCSSGSADWNTEGWDVCECEHGWTNGCANAAIAIPDFPF